MYAAPAALDADLFDRVWSIVQLAAVAFLAGWFGERLLGIGVRARGLPLLCGLIGLYAGSWVWSLGGWDGGPSVGGYGLLPVLVGALAVAGPRW